VKEDVDVIIGEGQQAVGSVAVVGGDFMLVPSRPSLTASTPSITFRITSTTPRSVIDSREIYSGPHDALVDGEDYKSVGKRVKGKERKQDKQVAFEKKLTQDKNKGLDGNKLVFGTTLEGEVDEGAAPVPLAKPEPASFAEAKDKPQSLQQVAEVSGLVPEPAKKQTVSTEPAKTQTPPRLCLLQHLQQRLWPRHLSDRGRPCSGLQPRHRRQLRRLRPVPPFHPVLFRHHRQEVRLLLFLPSPNHPHPVPQELPLPQPLQASQALVAQVAMQRRPPSVRLLQVDISIPRRGVHLDKQKT